MKAQERMESKQIGMEIKEGEVEVLDEGEGSTHQDCQEER